MTEILDKDRKCAIYIRFATSDQAEEGESLDEQIQKLKKEWADLVKSRISI